MHWQASAPANIALIKYMGKKDSSSNLPDNSSLSYTLNNLLTTVRLELIQGTQDVWQPLDKGFNLSSAGQQRYLAHLQRMKDYFNYQGAFLLQSGNNFPHGSGLASSASSFAALTRCAASALSDLTDTDLPSVNKQAQWSRQGSGSSCRSFYSPWVLWEEDEITPITLPYETLIHQVVIIDGKEKKVSSSEAHQRVKSSDFYIDRAHRAETRLQALLEVLEAKNWSSAYEICWHEFQDMHHLFSTCELPFSYMTERSIDLLNVLQQVWDHQGDGPIVTMDAGPNIHLLYRPDQLERAEQFEQDYLAGNYHVL